LFYVKADPGQIEQVVMNLAVNARDAMPQGGRLIIETANINLGQDYARESIDVRPGEYVVLTVSDTGCGMDEKTKARIFEPFFTTKEVGKGTGLGLSTVYGIIKQSGGHIRLYSEPGCGTTFKIYLPRLEELVDSPSQHNIPAPLPHGTETVLLVEDETSVRALATRVLNEQGYAVLEASNGEDALQVVEQYAGKDIHLLLADVVMPQMGGKDLASQMQILRPGIKMLFTSGYTDDAIVYDGVLDADIPFIQKPFTPGALVRKVREVLDASPDKN
jgi:CheY-like chemotaxis protein